LQRDEEFIFDAATIRRMERVVLGALEWRARSVTPLAFLGFFLSACFPPPRSPPLLDAVRNRAVDLLIRAQPGTYVRARRAGACHNAGKTTNGLPSDSNIGRSSAGCSVLQR
jgi:hypothetical protein